MGNSRSGRLYKQACYFFTNLLPKAQTSSSCQIFTNSLFLLKGVKAASFGHLEPPILGGSHAHKINFCSPVNLSYINLIIRPTIEPRREEGKFSSPPAEWTEGCGMEPPAFSLSSCTHTTPHQGEPRSGSGPWKEAERGPESWQTHHCCIFWLVIVQAVLLQHLPCIGTNRWKTGSCPSRNSRSDGEGQGLSSVHCHFRHGCSQPGLVEGRHIHMRCLALSILQLLQLRFREGMN